jgi:hypothetical protein
MLRAFPIMDSLLFYLQKLYSQESKASVKNCFSSHLNNPKIKLNPQNETQ